MVWKQGTSGNPGGAARVKPFRDALRLELAAVGQDHNVLRRVARALLTKAAKGDLSAISLLADRLDGKVPQEIGGAEELGPQRLSISWAGTAPSANAQAVAAAVATPLGASACKACEDA